MYCSAFCENTPMFSCTPTPRHSKASETRLTFSEKSAHETVFHVSLPKS